MAIVVSDTSPIVALAFLRRLELLPQLFGDVLIPPAVVEELRKPAWQGMADEALNSPFIFVRAATDRKRIADLSATLDPGESEALSLALEVRASAVLIDEADGREAAQKLGLVTIGVLGILSAGKQRGLISAVGPEIQRLRSELGFFVSPDLLAEVLKQAGE